MPALKSRIMTFNSIAIIVGLAGFLSAFVTMFIDVNQKISVKWFLFFALVSFSMLTIAAKIIHDLLKEVIPPPIFFEKPIKSYPDKGMLIIKHNKLFNHNSVVGGYWDSGGVESFIFIGFIYHTQDSLMQVKVIKLFNDEEVNQDIFSEDLFGKVIIKPTIPFNVMNFD